MTNYNERLDEQSSIDLRQGDCLEVMKDIPDGSVDAIITDPPYGYSFMGKDWDKAVPSVEIWKECLRVLKPGAFACVMSAPRSDVQNAMISRLMEAGFRLDFTPIYWSFASGFPKAMNLERKLLKDAESQKAQVRELWRTVFSESQRVEEEHDRWNLPELLEDLEQGEQCQVTSESITRQEVQIPEGQLQSFLERWSDLSQAQRELHQCEVCSLPTGVLINGKRRWLCYGTQASDGSVYWTVIDEDGMCTSSQSRPLGQSARQPDAVCDECRTQKVRALTGGYGGFQPKPAVEVVLVAMKPLSEKTYIAQALKNGKGITWLDDCRVPYDADNAPKGGYGGMAIGIGKPVETQEYTGSQEANQSGRFPANLLVSDDMLNDGINHKSGSYSRYFDLDKWAAAHLTEQQMKTFPFAIVPKASKSEKNKGLDSTVSIDIIEVWNENGLTAEGKLAQLRVTMDSSRLKATAVFGMQNKNATEWSMSWFGNEYTDKYLPDTKYITSTTTSSTMTSQILDLLERYFINEYTADVNYEMVNGGSPAESVERSNTLIVTMNERMVSALGAKNAKSLTHLKISVNDGRNVHPTCKPLKLMSYLITLFSREGDTVLDPFVGSGTTGVAAKNLKRNFIGIELDEEYFEIAKRRIEEANQ